MIEVCNRVCLCRLDLDAWINEPPSESESEDERPKAIFAKEEHKHSRPRHTEVDEKELARVCWLMIVPLMNLKSFVFAVYIEKDLLFLPVHYS